MDLNHVPKGAPESTSLEIVLILRKTYNCPSDLIGKDLSREKAIEGLL
jgi:hypothetical protein